MSLQNNYRENKYNLVPASFDQFCEVSGGETDHGNDYRAKTTPLYFPHTALLESETECNWVRSESQIQILATQVERFLNCRGIDAFVESTYRDMNTFLLKLSVRAQQDTIRIYRLKESLSRHLKVQNLFLSRKTGEQNSIYLGILKSDGQVYKPCLRSVLESSAFKDSSSNLCLALGCDAEGHPVVVDMQYLPNIILEGTACAEKSVCIDSMILSLLFRNKPDELKLILVGTEREAFTAYDEVPHLLATASGNVLEANNVVGSAFKEAKRRMDLLKKSAEESITSYNYSVSKGNFYNVEAKNLNNSIGEACKPVPELVIIIDDMNLLLKRLGPQFEYAISELAHYAPKLSIHLIMSSQTPLNGLIKSGRFRFLKIFFPGKSVRRDGLCYEEIRSGTGQIVLMSHRGEIMPVRGSFVSQKDVQAVVEFWASQYRTNRIAEVQDVTGEDQIYDQAIKIALEAVQISAYYLQNQLNIDFEAASSILKRMERIGLVSIANKNGIRDVLI